MELSILTKWRRLLIIVCIIAGTIEISAQRNVIHPNEIWPDQNGDHIQAHGGGIIKVGSIFYWYGEERRQGLDPNYRYVSCYSSKDLTKWEFQGDVLKLSDPDSIGKSWVLERPKVFYNSKTKKYVMYMHLDGPKGGKFGYLYARVGVAISDKATGPFSYIRSFRPLGYQSRDIGQFIDDDGTAYLIFEDRPNGFHIARLSEDYLDVEKDMCLIKASVEGGSLIHYKGLYYVVGSALTGFKANPNKYATAKSLEGPWSEFVDVAPPNTNTYGSQSTMMLKISGNKDTTVIFIGDVWKNPLSDSRYLWMPVEIGDGKLWLPEPKPWTINVKTGEHTILPIDAK
jgi:hypothetical protein